MSLILLIETATAVCSVGVARNGEILALRESHEQRSHAELITVFIQDCLAEAQCSMDELDAVAVSRGPGSYTGLRIGVSTAKGICFAKDIPLIAIDTLTALAFGFSRKPELLNFSNNILVPMIDARRMEVYTATFDTKMQQVEPVSAKIINKESFDDVAKRHHLWLFGDGAAKCAQLFEGNDAIHIETAFFPSVTSMAPLAHEAFQRSHFESVAYFEPFYLKDFVAGIPKVKGLHVNT